MSKECVEISDDDESFEFDSQDKSIKILDSKETLTSDEETDHELPQVNVPNVQSKKAAVIKNLFPSSVNERDNGYSATNPAPKKPMIQQMITGIPVQLPVEPYPCQKALMSTMINAMKNGKNCLLESPTGSGKTLAMLCAALAWQEYETDQIAKEGSRNLLSDHPELSEVKGVKEYVASPIKGNNLSTLDKFFTRTNFGEKSIYEKSANGDAVDVSSGTKRTNDLVDLTDSPDKSLVMIHKKQRLDDAQHGGNMVKTSTSRLHSTPDKGIDAQEPGTPQKSAPTIYYGARTHKQLKQVIKEFSRTSYCGNVSMSLLASRDYACIREFDRNLYKSKNDMCRSCISKTSASKGNSVETNCKFYDNRTAINHDNMPGAFDLEDLIAKGEEKVACPFYAARGMALLAQIVFCPYNYLIDPFIRRNMQIHLPDNIVIVDEAHNIEDICRDTASFTFTRDQIVTTINELQHCATYRYANHDVLSHMDLLLATFKLWDQWFVNQIPLVNEKPVNFGEAVLSWEIQEFAKTLNNHNIGQNQYNEFHQNASIFCRRYLEDSRSFYGINQPTVTVIESMCTMLGYLFADCCKYMDDFRPVLIKNAKSSYSNRQESENLSLRLICMNPGIVFKDLKEARCIVLASGTLTPLISLHSELDTQFPLKVTPGHVIPDDRVWIGTLTTCPGGAPLECKSTNTKMVYVQDAIGEAVLRVASVTPHGVLCFMPSYRLLELLVQRWEESGVWGKLNEKKHVFMESRNIRDHNENMDDYYEQVGTDKGAILFAVYRGKVSEGMDFKDRQARAVITIGIPYPNMFDISVKEKQKYNDKYTKSRNLLPGGEWLRVQAYRALNQAVGRCVRHRLDWGAVLMIDARFKNNYFTEHVSKWARKLLGENHHTFESLMNSENGLESFMKHMSLREEQEDD